MSNDKFIPVVLDTADTLHILKWIKQVNYYNVSTDDGYDSLLRRLLSDPAIVAPPVGTPVKQGPTNATPGTPTTNPPAPPTRRDDAEQLSGPALLWKEKLGRFQEALVIATEEDVKFKLEKQIEECKQKIAELSGNP